MSGEWDHSQKTIEAREDGSARGIMVDKIPSVSVIIPVYNTAAYLVECLDSVMRQDMDDLEIMVVNDGSTDASAEIIERYATRDGRVVVLNHENKGAAVARNEALRMARGDYVMFLDSDDFYQPGLVTTAYHEISLNACDILIVNGRAFDDEGNNRTWHRTPYFELDERDENRIAPGLDWIRRSGGRIQQPGMKIYRREFIRANGLKFGDCLVGEDYFFFYRCMIKAERVAYAHVEGYCRRYRSDSHMTDASIRGTLERIKSFKQIMTTLDEVENDRDRNMIGTQHAYYAGVLWVRCLLRRDLSERHILLKEFHHAGLGDFIRQNKHDWTLKCIYGFMSLPEGLTGLQVAFARCVSQGFRSRSRLL